MEETNNKMKITFDDGDKEHLKDNTFEIENEELYKEILKSVKDRIEKAEETMPI